MHYKMLSYMLTIKPGLIFYACYLDDEGYYIYTEASKPRKKDDKARLISPVVRPGNGSSKQIIVILQVNRTARVLLEDRTFGRVRFGVFERSLFS